MSDPDLIDILIPQCWEYVQFEFALLVLDMPLRPPGPLQFKPFPGNNLKTVRRYRCFGRPALP